MSKFISNCLPEALWVHRGLRMFCISWKVRTRLSEKNSLVMLWYKSIQFCKMCSPSNGVWLFHFYVFISDLSEKLRKTSQSTVRQNSNKPSTPGDGTFSADTWPLQHTEGAAGVPIADFCQGEKQIKNLPYIYMTAFFFFWITKIYSEVYLMHLNPSFSLEQGLEKLISVPNTL